MKRKRWQVIERKDKDLLQHLLKIRKVKPNQRENFLNPPSPDVSLFASELEIDSLEMEKAFVLIEKAVEECRPIVIHGDYDVDGVCATAILWETLYNDCRISKAYPFIPNRFDEGYGITKASVEKINRDFDKPLLISVDCGITAVEPVTYAKKLGMDVIITDHHTPGEVLPKADAIIHTREIAGAGIAWLLALLYKAHQEIKGRDAGLLELVALATIADLQPLMGLNRQLVYHGLSSMSSTTRLGLRALMSTANVDLKKMSPYVVGWVISPRLNAAGRLESGMDALRLLCTRDFGRAQALAQKLDRLNVERQELTFSALELARSLSNSEDIVQVVSHQDWHEGVIGLVAGRLKEELYRPTVVITTRGQIPKGSARSIEGFDIVAALQKSKELLGDVGGHPMAAGFSIQEDKIEALSQALNKYAASILDEESLAPSLQIDGEISLEEVTQDLHRELQKLEPHGKGNPTPTFVAYHVPLLGFDLVGKEQNHLKMLVGDARKPFSAIGFGMAEYASNMSPGDKLDLAFQITNDEYRGVRRLQLKLKDLRPV